MSALRKLRAILTLGLVSGIFWGLAFMIGRGGYELIAFGHFGFPFGNRMTWVIAFIGFLGGTIYAAGIALLPGLVVLGWVWNMGRLLVEMEDEYLRMLEVRKMLWASAITLSICGGWGLVELFAAVPRLPVFFVFPIWCGGLAVGQLINRFTIGDGDCA